MMKTSTKSYSELISIQSFEERFEYLKLPGVVGDETFGGHRYLNQWLYKLAEWKSTRREVIIRDGGFDLAHPDYQIGGNIYVHHINPITIDDILERRRCVFDLDNLISTSFDTHNALHYGALDAPVIKVTERQRYDTCPWR